jgi:hypothetical protein
MSKVSDIGLIMNNIDKDVVLLTDSKIKNGRFIIEHIEIRQYTTKSDTSLGNYSLLTVFIKTDKGMIETKYDEGFRGDEAIESAVTMLTQYVGFASLINRALIELQS